MKKVFYYLSMAAIAATLGACSSNDDVDAGENETGTLGQTFLNVRIALSGSDDGTRAATDNGYVDGKNEESAVSSAKFLFFNEDDTYLTTGSLTSIDSTNVNSNVERKISATVVLGPTTVKPSTNIKMLTFLNMKDADFQNLMNKTYDKVLEMTTSVDYNVSSNVPYAEMTNSTYYTGAGTESQTKVQANIIKSDNFVGSENEAKEKSPVNVYVERTMAKVAMSLPTSTTTTLSSAQRDYPYLSDKFYYFPITSTVKTTYTNSDGKSVSGTDTPTYIPFVLDGTDGTHFAIKVLGCTPNVLNTSGYLMKKIDSATGYKYLASEDDAATEWGIAYWNKESDFRSYWAEDANYKKGETWQGLKFWSVKDFKGTDLTSGSLSAPVTASTYIYENTVTQDSAKYVGGTQHANVPTMLIVGQVVKISGENAPSTFDNGFYRYLGAFYTKEDDIKTFEKNYLKNYYVSTGSTPTYTKIDDNVLANLEITFATSLTAVDGSKQYNGVYFKMLSIANKNGTSTTYNATGSEVNIYSDDKGTAVDDINTKIAANFVRSADGSSDNAIYYYNKGYCFYQVPIEHPVTYKDQSGDNLASGTIYGVVRNHSYELKLNSITTVGQSVAKTDETIELIPGKDKYYYLGTQINVLAWRNVTNQSVDL